MRPGRSLRVPGGGQSRRIRPESPTQGNRTAAPASAAPHPRHRRRRHAREVPRRRARPHRKFVSGPKHDAARHDAPAASGCTRASPYDAVSIGYPGVVFRDRIAAEPHNLGNGLGGIRLRARARQAGAHRQRRRHAGDRQLQRRPHAVSRARHRARRDADHRRGGRAHRARPHALQARPHATRTIWASAAAERRGNRKWRKAVERGGRAAAGARSRPTTWCSAAATRSA